MRKITAKQSIEFNNRIKSLLTEHNFSFVEEEHRCKNEIKATKDTVFGEIEISVFPVAGYKVYSVFTKFKNPGKALEVFECNPHTGKYNFHYDDTKPLFFWFECFLNNLDME